MIMNDYKEHVENAFHNAELCISKINHEIMKS